MLMEADPKAKYFETIEINMDELKEPILCAPNDPDDAVLLSDVMGRTIDEVTLTRTNPNPNLNRNPLP